MSAYGGGTFRRSDRDEARPAGTSWGRIDRADRGEHTVGTTRSTVPATTDAAIAALFALWDEATADADEQIPREVEWKPIGDAIAALRDAYSKPDRIRLLRGRAIDQFGEITNLCQSLDSGGEDSDWQGSIYDEDTSTLESVAALVEMATAWMQAAGAIAKGRGRPLADRDLRDLRIDTASIRWHAEQDEEES
jgi:hypothetical protein